MLLAICACTAIRGASLGASAPRPPFCAGSQVLQCSQVTCTWRIIALKTVRQPMGPLSMLYRAVDRYICMALAPRPALLCCVAGDHKTIIPLWSTTKPPIPQPLKHQVRHVYSVSFQGHSLCHKPSHVVIQANLCGACSKL